MPFIPNTPESRVARSDSKNPATTCRGITSGGRPCRRQLAASDTDSLSAPASAVLATPPFSRTKYRQQSQLRADDPRDERLYCWQHKEQAAMSARSSLGPHTAATPIAEEGRTSLDTLVDRLGLLSVDSYGRSIHGRRRRTSLAKPEAGAGTETKVGASKLNKSQASSSGFFCCFRVPLDEDDLMPPPRQRPQPRPQPRPATASVSTAGGSTGGGEQWHHGRRVPIQSKATPQMAGHVSPIPTTASPQTASALMLELAKPVSSTDEAGYIYMFWLTPISQSLAPPAEAARSLLAPPPSRNGQRRASDVVASFAAHGGPDSRNSANGTNGTGTNNTNSANRGTLLLKIGRANNVQRRLNEWKRQCGYDLSLIRYYHYVRSSAGAGATPRKVPHSHKVERLIHIELAGAGRRVTANEKCKACGREHREWFEVAATRKAVMEIDEVIRRWADWDEGRL